MRLRKPCEHDRYEAHSSYRQHNESDGWTWTEKMFACPGGEFLPEDAIVIEKESGEWPIEWNIPAAINAAAEADPVGHPLSNEVLRALWVGIPAFLDAVSAADQVGEPG